MFMMLLQLLSKISDHQQSWGYEDGPWKGPGPPLLVAADLLVNCYSLSGPEDVEFLFTINK